MRFPSASESGSFCERITKEEFTARKADRREDGGGSELALTLASSVGRTSQGVAMRAVIAQSHPTAARMPQTSNQNYGYDVKAAVDRRSRENRMTEDLRGATVGPEPPALGAAVGGPGTAPRPGAGAGGGGGGGGVGRESVARGARRLDRLERQLRVGRAERAELEARLARLRAVARTVGGEPPGQHRVLDAARAAAAELNTADAAGEGVGARVVSPGGGLARTGLSGTGAPGLRRGRLARSTIGREKLPGPVLSPLSNDFGWSHDQPPPNPQAVRTGSVAGAVRQHRVRPIASGSGPAGEAVGTMRALDLSVERGDHYTKFVPREPQPSPRGFVVPPDGLKPQFNWSSAPLSVAQAASLVRPNPEERRLKAGQAIETGGEPNHNRRSRPLTPGWKPRVVPNENPPFVLQPKMPRWSWGF